MKWPFYSQDNVGVFKLQSFQSWSYLQKRNGCGRKAGPLSEKLKLHIVSPQTLPCLARTGMGSTRFDICMDIWGLADEGLIGADLKCTSEKHFSLENP